MSAATAIADDELDQLFTGLERYRLLLLAVSGGSDSTALMHLIARWRQRHAGREQLIRVVTVDHALREASRDEADAVGRAAAALGFPHHVLTWREPKPAAGLQDAARSARYRLMTETLASLGEPNAALVTAHTAEDQAETLLMRLARGSGIDGLSAMPESRPLQPGKPYALVRPLLGVSKVRLVATLRAAGIDWSEDPSNTRREFERVRLRAATETLAELGLTVEALTASARRLQRARAALDTASINFEAKVLNVNGGAYASIRRDAFAAAPAEHRLRLLARVLSRFGGTSPPARLAKLETLVERLERNGDHTLTLGGCVIVASPGEIRVFREPGRTALPAIDLQDDTPVVWDERFEVSVSGLVAGRSPVRVRSLGPAGYATLKPSLATVIPRRAAITLPAFWQGDALLAVPGLGAQPVQAAPFTFRTEFLGLPDPARNSGYDLKR